MVAPFLASAPFAYFAVTLPLETVASKWSYGPEMASVWNRIPMLLLLLVVVSHFQPVLAANPWKLIDPFGSSLMLRLPDRTW